MPAKKQSKISAKSAERGQKKSVSTSLQGVTSKERQRHKKVAIVDFPIAHESKTSRTKAVKSRTRINRKKIIEPEKLTPEQIKEREEADREWERILSTPESDMVIAMMAIEIEEEIANGTVTEGGWDEV